MRKLHFTKRMHQVFNLALVVLFVASLVCLNIPVAYADDPDNPGSEQGEDPVDPTPDPDPDPDPDPGPTPDPEPDPDPGPTPDPQPDTPKIYDVGIYTINTTTYAKISLGLASDYSEAGHGIATDGSGDYLAQIGQRGGTLQLYDEVTWGDGSVEERYGNVTWSSSDSSIATVDQTGLVRARGDGVAVITVTVSGDRTNTGSDISAWIYLWVFGQTDSPYITDIHLFGPDGTEVTNGYWKFNDKHDTAQVQFSATVTVFYPLTGETKTLSTKDGLLSAQEPQLSDLRWYVADSALGSVEENYGMYRPSEVSGINYVYCTTSSTIDGKPLTASVAANYTNPDQDNSEGYHPQDSLSIKVYWETNPPRANSRGTYDDDDPAFVINKTYSLGDLQSLGYVYANYTLIASDHGYYTATGEGVALANIFTDAGVAISDIKLISFRTADWPSGLAHPVSPGAIFGDHYYYPNYDVGSSSGAQQVYPIIAWNSAQRYGVSEGSTDLTEATRYRLLYGAQWGINNASNSIKWINTIYIELAGGPAIDPEDPQPDDPDNPVPIEGDTNTSGSGTTGGTNAGGGSQGANNADASASPSEAAAGDAGGVNGEAYSIYSVIGNNSSHTDPIVIAPIVHRLAAGMAILVFILGGFENAIWYRRQIRPIPAW